MSAEVNRLESDLRLLIEPERSKFVELVYDHYKKIVNSFLERRKPNKFIEDLYDWNAAPVDLIRAATTYFDAVAEYHKQYRAYLHFTPGKKDTYPNWEVSLKPDGEEALRRLAEAKAEEYIATFLRRALEKLGPVVDRKPGYTVSKIDNPVYRGRFEGGAWTGFLEFSWDDNVKFVAQLKIITNFSKFSQPYAQYPMTFHGCALDATAEQEGRSGRASIEQIWESVGYKLPPKPEAVKRRWKKLVSGSVVEVDGKPVLILTPAAARKQGVPDDALQLARIEAQSSAVFVEFADGRREKHRYTDEEESQIESLERDYKFNKATALRREIGFSRFFGK